MPATKHMANHLTRVPKLSVEASRTLIGREEKEDITNPTQILNNLKNIFFYLPSNSWISNKIIFLAGNNYFTSLNNHLCINSFILQNYIINLEHMETYLQTNKTDKIHKGVSWHASNAASLSNRFSYYHTIANLQFAEELIYLCNTVGSYRHYHLFLLLERIPCTY